MVLEHPATRNGDAFALMPTQLSQLVHRFVGFLPIHGEHLPDALLWQNDELQLLRARHQKTHHEMAIRDYRREQPGKRERERERNELD